MSDLSMQSTLSPLLDLSILNRGVSLYACRISSVLGTPQSKTAVDWSCKIEHEKPDILGNFQVNNASNVRRFICGNNRMMIFCITVE